MQPIIISQNIIPGLYRLSRDFQQHCDWEKFKRMLDIFVNETISSSFYRS